MRSSDAIHAGLVLALVAAAAVLAVPGVAVAADPTAPGAEGGDPRSPGEGPGLVGDPLVAIGIVLAIALAALVGTLLYVRATGGPRPPGNR
jgi:hypothetical protein